MEGLRFRERREGIEGEYNEVDLLINQKSVEAAMTRLEKTREMVTDLSKEDLTEIQKRSVVNMRIKADCLNKNLKKVKVSGKK